MVKEGKLLKALILFAVDWSGRGETPAGEASKTSGTREEYTQKDSEFILNILNLA